MMLLFFLISHSFAQISGEVIGTSNFIWRGVSFSHNKPALQAILDYDLPQNFTLGTFASNAEFDDPSMGKATEVNHEIDLYLAKHIEGPNWNLTLTYSYFTFGDAHFFNADEFNAKFEFNNWNVELSYMDDFFGYRSTYRYARIGRDFNLSEKENLQIFIGYNHFTTTVGSPISRCLDQSCTEQAFGLSGAGYTHYIDLFFSYNRELFANTILQLAYNVTNREEYFFDGNEISKSDGKDNSAIVTLTHKF